LIQNIFKEDGKPGRGIKTVLHDDYLYSQPLPSARRNPQSKGRTTGKHGADFPDRLLGRDTGDPGEWARTLRTLHLARKEAKRLGKYLGRIPSIMPLVDQCTRPLFEEHASLADMAVVRPALMGGERRRSSCLQTDGKPSRANPCTKGNGLILKMDFARRVKRQFEQEQQQISSTCRLHAPPLPGLLEASDVVRFGPPA
jgi:hypothetical protein